MLGAESGDGDMKVTDNIQVHLNSYKDYKTAYFDNLTTNYGKNYKGSCGYIAIGMILSYYDTYMNDHIIPEQYDIVSNGSNGDLVNRRNSPGILKDKIDGYFDNYIPKSINDYDYYEKIVNMKDYSLHANLISIGIDLGYYKYNEENGESCLTTIEERTNIINDYLANVVGYKKGLNYTYDYFDGDYQQSNSNSVRSYVIEQVKAGHPVLLSISKTDNVSHAVVAYDYDEDEDKLYCHMGLEDNNTHMTPEFLNYTRYNNAFVLKFSIDHSHSNNYSITTNGITNYYCYHSCMLDTKAGVNHHGYDNKYEYYSKSKHIAYCECGLSKTENHMADSSREYKVGKITYNTCVLCKATLNMGNSFSPIA